jgi:hypothetical protein
MRRALGLAGLLLLAMACGRPAARTSLDVVALIDGQPLRLSAFRRYFESNAGRAITESSPKVVSALFDQFLREEIWRHDAGLHGSDDADDRRQAPAVLLERAGASVRPTEAEVDREYDAHPEKFDRPEEARVDRIFTIDRADAEKARARVLRGEDFAAVARELSRAPDAPRGGRMGNVERGDLPAEFETAIFRLKAGEVSPVIPAEDGFLIFRVEDKSPERRLSREEAAPGIVRDLARRKADAYLASLVAQARRQGKVRVLADHLPFVYTGEFVAPEE